MQNAYTIGWSLFGALFILTLASETSYATEAFEGLWAKTHQECLDEESPNSRTLIDLGNLVDGKPSPILDRYENHCRIDRKSVLADGTVLSVTCFEFEADYTKGINGEKATIKLSSVQRNTLKIDGIPYRRCEANAAAGQQPTAPPSTQNAVRPQMKVP